MRNAAALRPALARVLRHRMVVAGLAVLVMGSATAIVALSSHPHRAGRVSGPTSSSGSAPTARTVPAGSGGSGLAWHDPATVSAPGSPAQEEYDQAFTAALGGQAGIAAAAAYPVPAAAIGGGWPTLAEAETPEAWATEFVAGLLDLDYATRSRAGLGAWIQAEEAPMLLPGLPATVADKVAYLSLLDPAVLVDQPSPVPDPATWRADAAAGLVQSVSDLVVGTDPSWAQVTAAGWQPTDARMAGEDVSGLLRLTAGTKVTVHHFSMVVFVGSARWHDGYGTSSVTGWSES